MDRPSIKACEQAGWPLCRAYLFALVESLAVEVEERDSVRTNRRFHWALGVLSNGEYEVLGGWLESSVPGVFWEQLFDDLKARGLERIRSVVASGPAMDEAAMQTAFPAAMLLASITDLSRLSSGEVARRDDREPIEVPTAANSRLAQTASDTGAGRLLADSPTAHEDGSSAAAQAPTRTTPGRLLALFWGHKPLR